MWTARSESVKYEIARPARSVVPPAPLVWSLPALAGICATTQAKIWRTSASRIPCDRYRRRYSCWYSQVPRIFS